MGRVRRGVHYVGNPGGASTDSKEEGTRFRPHMLAIDHDASTASCPRRASACFGWRAKAGRRGQQGWVLQGRGAHVIVVLTLAKGG